MMGMIFRMSGPAAMPPETMLENLQRALSRFASGPLRGGAAELLETLGYRSERTGEEEETAEFLAWADARNQLTPKQRAPFASWRRAALVFQVTADEVAEQAEQASLSGQDAFDRGRIRSFLFLAVDLAAGAYARDSLTAMTRAVNRLFPMPVVVLFRHGSALTLAVVHRRAHRRDDERDVLEKVTLVKDIDLAEPRRAHLEILRDLALPRLRQDKGVRNFDDLHAAWEAALDIEALNRRFYAELFQWFERAVAQCRFPDDGAGRGGAERHVIRLITRLLFIWFLKEKELVPGRLFDESFAREALKRYDPDKTDYYRAVLQNLFFATLNTEIARRAFSTKDNRAHRDFNKYRCRALLADPQGFLAMLRGVPFVNGGLFDCLDDFEGRNAGGRRIDAFTDNPAQHRDLSVPARLFFAPERGLFPLFERYKFTVEENTPLDRDVALDPELLGRVFENLLAAYNPETQETARKATGSYYTPRHIVDYMVGEALAAALAANSRPTDGDDEFWRGRLRYLLDYEAAFDDAGELFDAAETEAVIRAVAGLRVLDPAAGSGAFPMGVLHKLTLALRRLDPDNARWEKLQKEQAGGKAGKAFEAASVRAREEELLDISRTFELYRDSDFGRKLYLMQNGIFGVDIQPVACQIAKLRFFISLVIEQRANDDPQDNYGIRPLPNLETRFVAADALIGLGVKKRENGVFGNDAVGRIENRLQRVRERYFNARTRDTKLKLRKEDAALRADLAEALQDRWVAGQDSAEAVAVWDPYDQNVRAPWFDAEWMFGVTDGFHVVIGNPPYVRGEKIPDKARLPAEFGDFYRGTADIYAYFFKKGVDFLAANGLLCFITSNKFMRANYGMPLRVFLKQEAPPRMIVDFGELPVFEAGTDPSILLAGKGGTHEELQAAAIKEKEEIADLPKAFEQRAFSMRVADLSDNGWSLIEPALLRLRGKIEKAGKPLTKYLKEGPYYGIKTGLDAAFVIDEETCQRLIGEDPNSKEFIQPWLRGKDVRRWRTDWANLYIIAIASSANRSWPWSSESQETAAVAIFKKTYPAVYGHLSRFQDKLIKRQDKGKFFWELRTCTYYQVFDHPKIVYSEMGKRMRALIEQDGRWTNKTCFTIPGDDGYLLALLNSKLLDIYFRIVMPCLGDPFSGGRMLFGWIYMKRTPIASAEPETKKRLAALANRIQQAKQAGPADASADECELNRLVYDLYGLDASDIALIEKTAGP